MVVSITVALSILATYSIIFYLPEQKLDAPVNVSNNTAGYQISCTAHQAGQPL